MRLTTHYIFTIGIVALAARPVLPPAVRLSAAIWLGILVNWLIDHGGHEVRGGIPRRTAITHSVPGAVGVGVALGIVPLVAVLVLAPSLAPLLGVQSTAGPLFVLLAAALGGLAGLSHLLLDALTEGGIFHHGRRWALAHWRYDNAAANALFVLLGLVMLGAAFMPVSYTIGASLIRG